MDIFLISTSWHTHSSHSG